MGTFAKAAVSTVLAFAALIFWLLVIVDLKIFLEDGWGAADFAFFLVFLGVAVAGTAGAVTVAKK